MIYRMQKKLSRFLITTQNDVFLRMQNAPRVEALPIKAIRKYGCQANVYSALKIANPFILRSGTVHQSDRSSVYQGMKPPGFPSQMTINVATEPILITSKSFSSFARMLGRKLLCPPTLMPPDRQIVESQSSPR